MNDNDNDQKGNLIIRNKRVDGIKNKDKIVINSYVKKEFWESSS